MRSVLVMACVVALAGCETTTPPGSSYAPQIDSRNVNSSRYAQDVQECNKLASANPEADAGKQAKKGAMRYGIGTLAIMGVATVLTAGAAGVALAAVVPAVAGTAATTAGGAAVMGGATHKEAADLKYKNIVQNCLQGRGYNVVG